MCSKGLNGPFFFENEEGKAQTVNTERYIEKLEMFVQNLRRKRIPLRDAWLMQDGATPHTSRESLRWLSRHFQERIVSLKTEFELAPHSPDLNPLDFNLWGH